MSKHTIEEEITRGQALWIDCTLYDPEAQKVIVKFVSDPDCGIIDRVLIFEDVKDYAESIHSGPDPGCLDDFLGLQEEPRGDATRFELTTGEIEASFLADPAPSIEWARTTRSDSDVERSTRISFRDRLGPDGKPTRAHDTGERLKTDADSGE